MPAPGELKRRKKTKNPFRWIKEKIIDPVFKKLKPHIQTFLKTKFGSSMKKFVHWLNESVIQQDKYGLMNAIKSVVPGGQYLDQALKIAGNLADRADYDKVGEFIERLIYQSDKQDAVIKEFGKYEDTGVGRLMTESEKLRERVNTEVIQPALRVNTRAVQTQRPAVPNADGAKTQPARVANPVEENEDDDQALTKNQLAAKRIFGKPIN